MGFRAYEPTPPLVFPIGGKEYTVVPIDEREFTEGLRWQQIFNGAEQEPPLEDQPKLVLGAVFDQMVTDHVPSAAIARAGWATLADFRLGRDAAEHAWESGLDPEALAAVLAANPASTPPTPLTSTGAAAKTRTRASTSGTRTSRKTSAAKAKASQS